MDGLFDIISHLARHIYTYERAGALAALPFHPKYSVHHMDSLDLSKSAANSLDAPVLSRVCTRLCPRLTRRHEGMG